MKSTMNIIPMLLAMVLLPFVTRSQSSGDYYQKGFKAANEGNHAAAIYYLDQSIALAPDIDSAHAMISYSYYWLGKLDKAFEHSNRALVLRPGNAFAWFVKGAATALVNVSADSILKVIKKHKKDSAWLAGNLWSRYYVADRSSDYPGIYDYAKAIDLLSKSIALDSSFVTAYAYRGHFHFSLNHYAEAEHDYTKCIMLDPENPYHYLNRGNFYDAFGPPGHARDDYTTGIGLDSTMAELYEKRGMLYYRLHDKEYACKDLRKATLLGRYIENLDDYCTMNALDSLFSRAHDGFRHDYRHCVCPNPADLYNPETDTFRLEEIAPGITVKVLDIKDSEKTTWEFDEGRVITISKKTRERWLKEEEEQREKEILTPVP